LPNPNAINPLTGKRYGWEAEQAARKAQSPSNIAQQIALLERLAIAKKAQDDLLTFTQFTMPDPEHINDITKTRYEAANFHKIVAKHLEEVERGEITQLIFCMPPRHGKTELATKRLAAWFSGRHPEQDVIVAAAGDDLASDFGGDVRSIMGTPQYKQVFPNHKLRKGGTAKDNIQTVQGGRLVFAGRGGQINGRGAHLLLVDDLYKDANEARSQAIRDSAWDWFVKVALYRRMGKRLTIITMTRWHSDDIIGRLTDPENPCYNAQEAAGWKIIRLPGLAEEDDPLGRKPGEALWPEKRRDGSAYDVAYHMANQRRDPLGFAALTQQRPTVADGVLFRRENIQRYDPKDLPENLRFYCASDHAVSTKQRNDPSCFGKAGVDAQDNLWFTELFWERVKSDRAVEQMLVMGSGNNAPLIWWAESGHISKSIGPFLNKRMLETERYINVREIVPSVDKETRAQSIAARVALGKVYIPKGPIWDKAVEEMLAFPNGTHDDFVDMLSLFGLGLQSQFGKTAPSPKQAEPKFGTAAWLKFMDEFKAKQRQLAGTHGGF
jgi:predicted phage terminase large subunit-like protein